MVIFLTNLQFPSPYQSQVHSHKSLTLSLRLTVLSYPFTGHCRSGPDPTPTVHDH